MADNRFIPKKFGQPIKQAITMYIDNGATAFHGWEEVSVSKSIDSFAHEFSFQIPQKFEQTNSNFKIAPGSSVSIFVNKERVTTGYVDAIDVSYAAERKVVVVSGRSKSADLVDCTHSGANEYKNVRFETLVKELISPFGLKAFYSVVPAQVTKLAVKPGETVFEILDKIARLQGFFWITTRAGNIRLTRAGRGRADSRIEEGVNMKVGQVMINDSERHSDYTVKGQAPGSDSFPGVTSSTAMGKATDAEISRHRPLTLIAEGNVDSATAKTRAQWEATTRLARSVKINITVQNWQQQSTALWGLNQLLRIKSKTLGLDGDFLSTSIEHVRGNGVGTLTRIGLTRQDAYTPSPVIEKGSRGANSLEAIVARSQLNS